MPVFTRGDWEEIGTGQSIRRVYRDGELEALDWQHGCTNAAEDYIPLNRPGETRLHSWEIASEQPLTITPSLLCTARKVHGFIRQGSWVPA